MCVVELYNNWSMSVIEITGQIFKLTSSGAVGVSTRIPIFTLADIHTLSNTLCIGSTENAAARETVTYR